MSSASSSVQPGVLLGMGNPLLDISTAVKTEFIEKYGLKANDAILYEKEDIYDDLKKNYGSTIEHIAGGATQNSMRVAQWILGKSGSFLRRADTVMWLDYSEGQILV